MTTTNPPRCSNTVMTRYNTTGHIMLLDNINYPVHSFFTNNTWIWDGADWSAVEPTGTPPIDAGGPLPGREDAVMYFRTNSIVMFGGTDQNSYLNDTWRWREGAGWDKLSPVTSPSARGKACFCKSANAANAVLFGGINESELFFDTWHWNGTNWIKMNPANHPAARYNAAMSGSASLVYMFGGKNESNLFNDTWTWNETDWVKLNTTNNPPPRHNHTMIHHSSDAYMNFSAQIVFGGETETEISNETWLLDPVTLAWRKATPTHSPPPRTEAQMALDGVNDVVILFGGKNNDEVLNDSWAWDGSDWEKL